LLSACDQLRTEQPTPDSGSHLDASFVHADASSADASHARDAGAGSDAEAVDAAGAASPDGGWAAPHGEEGGPCVVDGGVQGGCVDPRNVCIDWSPPRTTNPVSSCIRPCATDADCAASSAGHICAAVRFDLKACVDHTVGLGGKIETSSRDGHVMTGCAPPDIAVPPLAGSRLLALDDDEASCGERCSRNSDCPATVPFCSLGAITSTGPVSASGLCQVRRAERGARCSRARATAMCDTTHSVNMVCLDLMLGDGDTSPDAMDAGNCVEICTSARPSCAIQDPLHTAPVCTFGFFASNQLGVCSDGCTPFPESCTGPGSPPVAGDTAAGMNCALFGGTPVTPVASLCIDISQKNNILLPWDFRSTAMECRGQELRCPHGTSCATVTSSGGQMSSACLFGCSTATGTVTCAAQSLTCHASSSSLGFCTP
jgi:hypothetical protein